MHRLRSVTTLGQRGLNPAGCASKSKGQSQMGEDWVPCRSRRQCPLRSCRHPGPGRRWWPVSPSGHRHRGHSQESLGSPGSTGHRAARQTQPCRGTGQTAGCTESLWSPCCCSCRPVGGAGGWMEREGEEERGREKKREGGREQEGRRWRERERGCRHCCVLRSRCGGADRTQPSLGHLLFQVSLGVQDPTTLGQSQEPNETQLNSPAKLSQGHGNFPLFPNTNYPQSGVRKSSTFPNWESPIDKNLQ